MSVSVTAVSGYRARVTITPPAGTAGTMTLYRDDLGTARVAVRGAVGVPAVGDVFDDTAAPLNRPLFYVVVYSSGVQETSPATTIVAARPVLSNPITGDYVEVTISTWTEIDYPQRVTILDIEGRRARMRIADVEGAGSSPEIKLRTELGTDLRTVRLLAAAGETLLLRGSCVGIEDAYLGMGGRVEQRLTTKAADWRRHHLMKDVLLQDEPAPDVRAAGDTLGDLYAAVPTTLGDIADAWATLLGIAQADLRSA